MRDFENGWAGLKAYAVKTGIAEDGDGDDQVAAKIKAIIRDTLPKEDKGGAKRPDPVAKAKA